MKVLIIEDDPSMVTVLKMFLEPLSSEVIHAPNMEQALAEIASAREIEIITLDLGLPDSGVNATIERIKEIRKSRPQSLLIVVTGQEVTDLEKIATSYGADGVIYKKNEQFTPKGFLKFIDAIARKHIANPQPYQHSLSVLEKVMNRVHQLQVQQDATA